MDVISNTDLILNPDGSAYHLSLLPDDIAETILLVGDPGRVELVSSHFDSIEVRKMNREFRTHTGTYRGVRLSVVSTGIGTDNIDIVVNELDALQNINMDLRKARAEHNSLRLIRLGTSGALQEDIEPGSFIMSAIAGGMDNLYHFYREHSNIEIPGLSAAFMEYTGWNQRQSHPYFVRGSEELMDIFTRDNFIRGITLSAPGFYGPQARSIRLTPFDTDLIESIGTFRHEQMRVNNMEMECSALYALAGMLGHRALTVCVAVANRVTRTFLEDYHPHINQLIAVVLDKLATHE